MMNIISPTRQIHNKGIIKVEEEDNAHILMQHKNGTISHVQSGFNYTMAHSYESEQISTLSLIGTKARMDMIGYDWAPIAIDVATPSQQKMQRLATDPGTYVWYEGATAACEFLSTGKETLFKTDHALHVIEIIEAARRSQETGSRIEIISDFRHMANK
jgi:predicted dehydrogenase